MIELRARENEDARCPFCREDLARQELRGCGGCGVSYHRACALELGRCGTLGCARVFEEWGAVDGETCPGCAARLGDAPTWSCEACQATYHSGCARALEFCRQPGCGGALRGAVVWRGSSAGRSGAQDAFEGLVYAFFVVAVSGAALTALTKLRSRELQLSFLFFAALFGLPFALVGLKAWLGRRREGR